MVLEQESYSSRGFISRIGSGLAGTIASVTVAYQKCGVFLQNKVDRSVINLQDVKQDCEVVWLAE